MDRQLSIVYISVNRGILLAVIMFIKDPN